MDFKRMYESYLIEVRPRLQSVNAFFRFKNTTDVSTFNANFQNKFYITHDSREDIISNFFDIKDDSFNFTYIKGNFLCFRFCTNAVANSSSGSFGMEMLDFDKEVNVSKVLVENSFLTANRSYILKCKSCKTNCCADISFQRILPLPSDGCDSSDWFCHDHGKKEESNRSGNSQNITDLLYSDSYFHIHKSQLRNYSEEDKNSIHCKECYYELGTKLINYDDIFKLWNHKIIFEEVGSEKSITTEPLFDIFKIIASVIKDPLRRSTKLVINTSFEGVEEYILLWIMDKSLKVILATGTAESECAEIAKVLYLHSQGENDLVNEWLDNTEVFNINVSDEMFLALKEHLIEMSSYMPPEFIKSQHYNVSYLNIYKNL